MKLSSNISSFFDYIFFIVHIFMVGRIITVVVVFFLLGSFFSYYCCFLYYVKNKVSSEMLDKVRPLFSPLYFLLFLFFSVFLIGGVSGAPDGWAPDTKPREQQVLTDDLSADRNRTPKNFSAGFFSRTPVGETIFPPTPQKQQQQHVEEGSNDAEAEDEVSGVLPGGLTPDEEGEEDEYQSGSGWAWPCHSRRYPNQTSIVCVCTATYCDRPEPLGLAPGDTQTLVVYVSDARGKRLRRQTVKFGVRRHETIEEKSTSNNKKQHQKKNTNSNSSPRGGPQPYTLKLSVEVDPSVQGQKILGFGGAFPDAAGINWMALSEHARDQLIRTYFHPEHGSGYTLGRVPISSCDFSTHEYSYLDREGDFNLSTFSLAPEDHKYKIPMIKAAKAMMGGGRPLRLISSSWSAPAWMKTNGKMHDGGVMKGDLGGTYYRAYAQYFKRFFEEYAKQNITFWATTIQNEPGATLKWQTMVINSSMQRDFAVELLRPALDSSPASASVRILGHDDQRGGVADAARVFFGDRGQLKTPEVAGLAVHWYDHAPFEPLADAHRVLEQAGGTKFLLATEACTAYEPWHHKPLLGDWNRGVQYAHDIIQSLRHWVVGWTDWNLALDLQGGPNWVENFVDAPVVVNTTGDEFLKQPMFYALAHFSHFVPPGSVRVESRDVPSGVGPSPPTTFEHVAFRTPEGRRVLVVLNDASDRQIQLTLREKAGSGGTSKTKETAAITVPPDSIITAVWQ